MGKCRSAIVPAGHALRSADAVAIVGLVDEGWILRHCHLEADVHRAHPLRILKLGDGAAQNERVLLYSRAQGAIRLVYAKVRHEPIHDDIHLCVRWDSGLAKKLHVEARAHLRDADLRNLVLAPQLRLEIIHGPVEDSDQLLLCAPTTLSYLGVIPDLLPHVEFFLEAPFPKLPDHGTFYAEVLLHTVLHAAHGHSAWPPPTKWPTGRRGEGRSRYHGRHRRGQQRRWRPW
mmetsp:Transcript_54371/g.116869  ORF Transcript_54371/g.116869 Transcript_54371/m.116869 type:complete len:231 (-) Transcript_54371:6-698(-)